MTMAKLIKEMDLPHDAIDDLSVVSIRLSSNNIEKRNLINYKELLRKYVSLILIAEECDYMGSVYISDAKQKGITFTDEEKEVIKSIANSI